MIDRLFWSLPLFSGCYDAIVIAKDGTGDNYDDNDYINNNNDRDQWNNSVISNYDNMNDKSNINNLKK